jgi:SNF2 family DNA or RNA helicase
MQAVDRTHRIGQQKPVEVYRILVENTVEDRVINMKKKKQELIEAALNEKASQGITKLSEQDLVYLFNG